MFESCEFGAAKSDLKHHAIVLDDARIRGDLIFNDVIVNGCISARRIRLVGDMRFSACTVTGDATDNIAALNASDSKIHGSVIFETGKSSRVAAISAPSTDNSSARSNRSVFCDCRKSGAISVLLRGSKVTDMVNLAWSRFEGDVNLAFVKCRSLESDAEVLVRPPDEIIEKSGKRIRNYPGATINGALILSGGSFGLIHLFGISVSGEMRLIAGKSGQISIEDAVCKIGNNKQFVTTSRLDHFVMSRWHCSDFLHLHAAAVTGERSSSSVRGIAIKSSVIDRAVSFWPGLNVQRRLEQYLLDDKGVQPDQFAADGVDGRVAEAENHQECRDLLNRWSRALIVNGNIAIDHCTIGDDVILTGVAVASKNLADGRIEIVDSKVDGNVVFRSLTSFLADAEVEAPLLWLLAQRLVVCDSTQRPLSSASCYALDMRGLQANNIDLTGLSIQDAYGQVPSEMLGVAAAYSGGRGHFPASGDGSSSRHSSRRLKTSASATMNYLKVSGKVAAFARLSEASAERIYEDQAPILDSPPVLQPFDIDGMKRKIRERQLLWTCFGDRLGYIVRPKKRLEANVEIPGNLDFQHSEIGELFLSDASFFKHSPEERAAESGIVLDYTQISKLYIARSELHDPRSRQHNGFPVPVSLLDLSVKAWFLEEEDAGRGAVNHDYNLIETKTVDPYLDLLDNDPEFRMSSYLAVEKSLRDRGLTAEATQVVIAANYRDVRTESTRSRPFENGTRPAWQNKLDAILAALWPRSKSGSWRRGDGRYRNALASDRVLAFVLCMLLVAAAIYPGINYLSLNPAIGLLCLSTVLIVLFGLRGNVFRLRRPLGEYVQFTVCTSWCILAAAALYDFFSIPSQFSFAFLSAVLIFLLTFGMAIRRALRRFVDQLYWSLVDYGTSAVRLAAVISVLMLSSFVLISGERANFEPTLLAELEAQKAEPPADPTKPGWDNNRIPTPQSWGVGERLWMTLRYHVPLVGAIISEEWQPAHRPLTVSGAAKPNVGRTSPDWWVLGDGYWPRARDWYAIMLWTNWILWPLFLPFLIHRLSRER